MAAHLQSVGRTNEIVLPYEPRDAQAELHRDLKRFSVLVCHRRFGKTTFAVNHALRSLFEAGRKSQRYAIVLPLYRQAKAVVWDMLKDYSRVIPFATFNESELRADYGELGRIQLFGGDNPDTLRGQGFDGVVLDEVAQIDPRLWGEVIRPALVDRKGWAVFMGTPRGQNAFYDLVTQAEEPENADEWMVSIRKASETNIVPESELAAARRQLTREQYLQEFECSWTASIRGAYYAREMEDLTDADRITTITPPGDALVHTSWDLGIGDATAIVMWALVGREIWIIDYYENSGAGLAHYVEHLRSLPYKFGDHYLPHDVKARELGTGVTRQETLQRLGLKCEVLPQQKVDDGINAVRNLLPRCWINEEKCGRLIEALRQYRAAWDDKRQMYRATPERDWTTHPADAVRYMAMAVAEVEVGVSGWTPKPENNVAWIR